MPKIKRKYTKRSKSWGPDTTPDPLPVVVVVGRKQEKALDKLRDTITGIDNAILEAAVRKLDKEIMSFRKRPPIYNRLLHKSGDLVRIWTENGWIEMVVPGLDGAGSEDYSSGRFIQKPIYRAKKFQPAPKPKRSKH